MTSFKTTYVARSLQLRRLVRVAIVVLFPGQLLSVSVRGAEDVADPYDVLYDVIMVRNESDRKAYGKNEVAPFIYGRSEFPFDDETFPKLTAAMERFNALPRKKIEAYGDVKRALLQRHLWAVFDATIWSDYMPPTQVANRRAAQEILAALVARVALTRAEILSLPDTRAATINNGGFPRQHDPKDRFQPFLPADLYAKDCSWVCLGKVDHYNTDHARMARWRSTFLQFARLPGGREATLAYVTKLNDREVFPIGTQFAIIDQAFLISDEGELVLSPFINSIQLRAYLNVTLTELEARPNHTQCVAEFVMQPRQLMQGKFAMRVVGPKDRRYKTLDVSSGGKVDWFEDSGGIAIRNMPPRLQQCVNCHGRSRPGVRSLGDFHHGDRMADRLTFEAGSPDKIAQAIAATKREDETWMKLQELWPRESSPKDPRR